MKRILGILGALLVLLPAAAFGVLLWMNLNGVRVEVIQGVQYLHLALGGGLAILTTPTGAFGGCFLLGLVLGVLATLLTFSGQHRAWREVMGKLRHDNRRLGAANRALEAALPVLRERYDAGLEEAAQYAATAAAAPVQRVAPPVDLAGSTLDQPIGDDEAEQTDLKLLALEDAVQQHKARG